MKIGIIPGWLLASVAANVFGGVPADLCAAGAAVGIGLSLAALAHSSRALSTAVVPIMFLFMRYVALRPLSSTVPQDAAGLERLAQAMVSPTGLIAISLLSIAVSWVLGMKWMYTGEV